MVTLQELRDLRLGRLGTAVAHWEQTVRKLAALAEGGDGVSAADLAARAKAAHWKGDNATVTKAFTVTTARQFTDILTEARSVHAVLRDAHTALAGHQRDLTAALARWHAENVRFDARGRAHGVVRHADNSAPDKPVAPEVLQAAAQEVAAILEAASETDRVAGRALLRHARSTHDFDETGYRSLRDADRAQGLADVNAALRLAAKGPDLTDAELQRFNLLARHHRDNPAFAEAFATRLGARGTLEFWRGLAGGPYPGPRADSARAELLAATQKYLGTTLATASHGTSPEMRAWRSGVIAAGGERVGENGPYGFQVTSALMRHGTWDSGFLNAYGGELIEFERANPRHGGPEELWATTRGQRLTYPETDSPVLANDPVNGFLEALGHNPRASLEFFTDHDHWKYLVDKAPTNAEARDWPTDRDGKTPGYAHLGHALEAATLGYPYDAVNPQVPSGTSAETTAARNSLMENVVEYYGSPSAIDRHDGIRPSLARMAAGYIDSLNYSVDDFGGSGEDNGREVLFGVERHGLHDFGRYPSAEFLRAVASEQSAYETVSAAQQLYGASAMAAQGDDAAAARHVGTHSVHMHGLLDEARSEAIGKEFADDAERRNLELEKQAAWRGFATSAVVGAGVGAGTALVTGTGIGAVLIPIAIETVGGAAETHVQTQMMDWLKANKYDNSDDAVDSLTAARGLGERQAVVPLLGWARSQGLSPGEVSTLMDQAEHRYVSGRSLNDTDDRRGH
ncbi:MULTISPECIES: DUF6571 family protein [Streptomyces]|uniref:Uncharacterized protein n=2 Tax=Streptomyces TaxID=1883 RepID=A0A100Y0R1_9ACTN|nr:MULTISPECIES: DUF6571 family protein [Streptomyces]KUH35564.1 hypothetical protein ATE80_28515 [Streptomyces kanasensis]UUS31482.1 hypothetical protein NRO40_11990 [Streptomyces changanensis]